MPSLSNLVGLSHTLAPPRFAAYAGADENASELRALLDTRAAVH